MIVHIIEITANKWLYWLLYCGFSNKSSIFFFLIITIVVILMSLRDHLLFNFLLLLGFKYYNRAHLLLLNHNNFIRLLNLFLLEILIIGCLSHVGYCWNFIV